MPFYILTFTPSEYTKAPTLTTHPYWLANFSDHPLPISVIDTSVK